MAEVGGVARDDADGHAAARARLGPLDAPVVQGHAEGGAVLGVDLAQVAAAGQGALDRAGRQVGVEQAHVASPPGARRHRRLGVGLGLGLRGRHVVRIGVVAAAVGAVVARRGHADELDQAPAGLDQLVVPGLALLDQPRAPRRVVDQRARLSVLRASPRGLHH